MSSVNRREFIGAALTACACALCPAIALGAENTTGTMTGAPPPAAPPAGPVDIGAASDYAKGGISDKFASNGFFVAHENGKIYAISTVCPHKRGRIASDTAAQGQLHCTKHKGIFDLNGNPISGPPKEALGRFGITKNDKGHLIVNTGQQIAVADWDKPGAFVAA